MPLSRAKSHFPNCGPETCRRAPNVPQSAVNNMDFSPPLLSRVSPTHMLIGARHITSLQLL